MGEFGGFDPGLAILADQVVVIAEPLIVVPRVAVVNALLYAVLIAPVSVPKYEIVLPVVGNVIPVPLPL